MVQALEDMRELAASDNVDTFVISYNSLLQVFPSIARSASETFAGNVPTESRLPLPSGNLELERHAQLE